MRSSERALASHFALGLDSFRQGVHPLPGIVGAGRKMSLIGQLVESDRRVRYVSVLKQRGVSVQCADPSSEIFDPLKAAIVHQVAGNMDEACFMVFYFVHFGKHRNAGWQYARNVYGRFGQSGQWDWVSTSNNTGAFRSWLRAHRHYFLMPGFRGGFGNHRKYLSLDADSPNGTGAAFESYVAWVSPPRNHPDMIADACLVGDGDRERTFEYLFNSMDRIASFGRVAKFDYLTMLGKLKIAPVSPGSPYLQKATGPLAGARLLFGQGHKPARLNNMA